MADTTHSILEDDYAQLWHLIKQMIMQRAMLDLYWTLYTPEGVRHREPRTLSPFVESRPLRFFIAHQLVERRPVMADTAARHFEEQRCEDFLRQARWIISSDWRAALTDLQAAAACQYTLEETAYWPTEKA